MKRWGPLIMPAFFGLWLATCGAIEAVQDRDATKAMLLVSWLTATMMYLTWKKRAIQVIDYMMSHLPGSPSPPEKEKNDDRREESGSS